MNIEKVVPLHGDDVTRKCGAVLLYADEPISIERLAELAEVGEREINWSIDRLSITLESAGLAVNRIANKVSLSPNPVYQHFLDRYKEINTDDALGIVDEYIAAKKIGGMRETTQSTYTYTLHSFMRFAGKNVERITTRDIRAYLTSASKSGNKQVTIAGKISVLQSFFKWLEREDYIDKDPMRKIDKPKVPKSAPKYLTDEQIEQMREVATGRDVVILETLYAAGLRVSEAKMLDWDHIDFQERRLNVYDGKGGKDRTVPLSVKALRALKKHKDERKDDDPYVFRSNYRRRMSKETLERRVNNLGKKAGLKVTVTPHKLRHSLGTHLLDRGMNLEEVQVILGHEEVKTTQIYARTQFANVEHNYRKFMP